MPKFIASSFRNGNAVSHPAAAHRARQVNRTRGSAAATTKGCPEITGGGGPDERECRPDRCSTRPSRSASIIARARRSSGSQAVFLVDTDRQPPRSSLGEHPLAIRARQGSSIALALSLVPFFTPGSGPPFLDSSSLGVSVARKPVGSRAISGARRAKLPGDRPSWQRRRTGRSFRRASSLRPGA